MPTHRETLRLVVRLQFAGFSPRVVGGSVAVDVTSKAQSAALAAAIGDSAIVAD